MKRVLALLLSIMLCFSLCACGQNGGDGKNSCRNCGRKTSLVAGYGYCSTCYKGFKQWQNNNGY